MQTLIKQFLKEYNPSNESNFHTSLSLILREHLNFLAQPRDMDWHPKSLERIRNYIIDNCEHDFVRVDEKQNIIMSYGNDSIKDKILLGCHYDGPGNSPGADDNASSIAVLIELSKMQLSDNVIIVFFNGEEYNMIGSRFFVKNEEKVSEAIILEMVGYYSNLSGSQELPDVFPKFDKGDFLTVIGNNSKIGKKLISQSNEINSLLPLKSFNIPFGLEKQEIFDLDWMSHIKRSDHSAFWSADIPAVMLTDTAEFRNKNYHQLTDTPETLNYKMMSELVHLLYTYTK